MQLVTSEVSCYVIQAVTLLTSVVACFVSRAVYVCRCITNSTNSCETVVASGAVVRIGGESVAVCDVLNRAAVEWVQIEATSAGDAIVCPAIAY